MTRESVAEYAAAIRPRYQQASKHEKGALLDEFCQVTGYHRKAAIRLLRRRPIRAAAERRGRPRTYDPILLRPVLLQLWEASSRICSKRLAPFLAELVAALVFHCGEQSAGFHLTTLVAVDVATGWVECQAVWGKGQERVGSAVHQVRANLPFRLRELHPDNGGEFLNHVLYPWCQRAGIRLTRGRPYKKNDQAYVEGRNWLVMRRLVGYDR